MIHVKDKPKGKKRKKGKIIPLKKRAPVSFLRKKWQDLICIVVAGLLAFSPILNNDFVDFDDMALIKENPVIVNDGIEGALTWGLNSPYYKPLVFLSWKIEKALFGFNPMVFHFNNLVIHLFNCVLLYFLVIGWSRFWNFTHQYRYQIAFLTALLFALHPMHVESVAWAVERKDVLFSAFFLSGLWAYMRYVDKGGWQWIALTAVCYLGSILCKAPGLMLIVVLFGYDFLAKKELNTSLVLPKIPVMLVCLLGLYLYGLFNHFGVYTQGATAGFDPAVSNGAKNGNPDTGNLLTGMLMMNFKMLFWFIHSLVPVKLSIAYPRAGFIQTFGPVINFLPLLTLALLFPLWKSLKSNRFIVFAAFFFLATLLPALVRNDYGIGIFLSDRYSYLPSISIIMGMVLFFIWLENRIFPTIRNFSVMACGSIALFYFVGTFTMSQVWKNPKTLWGNAIDKYPSISYSYANRSKFYLDNGQYNKALDDLNIAISIDDKSDAYYVERARAYRQLKNLDQATKDLEKALRLNPKNTSARVNRGNVLHDLQKFDLALVDFNTALEEDPDHLNALTNRASILGQFGKTDLALKDINHALSIQPNYLGALNIKFLFTTLLDNSMKL